MGSRITTENDPQIMGSPGPKLDDAGVLVKFCNDILPGQASAISVWGRIVWPWVSLGLTIGKDVQDWDINQGLTFGTTWTNL